MRIDLEGVGIGNSFTDHEEQYKWYAEMAKDGGKAFGGSLVHSAINSTFWMSAFTEG